MLFNEPAFVVIERACVSKTSPDAHHADVVDKRRHDRKLQLRLPIGVILQNRATTCATVKQCAAAKRAG